MTQTVSAQSRIDCPRHEAWAKLQDISLAHHYVPGLVKTEIVSDVTQGIGASRYVYRSEKSYLQETVTEWTEGEGFLIRLHKGDKPAAPFREAFFRYQLADGEANDTVFTATMTFSLPWGALGGWLEKRMASLVQKTIADVTASMKLYYETGQPTTPAALKAYKAGH